MSLALLLGTELQVDLAAGHTVFGISSPGPFVPEVEALGVQHVPLPAFTRAWDPRRDLAAARQLVLALRTLHLDVLHTHTPKAGVLGRVLGRVCGVPVIVNTVHGLWAAPDDPLPKRAIVVAAEAFAAQFSDAELYQNAEDRRRLCWAVPPRRSLTVGNGVDLERFQPDPDARRAIRAEMGVPDGGLVVGGVGRRVAEKGINEFAAMARSLAERAVFVWVGPPDEAKPDHLDEELPGVCFLGLRRDVEAIYAALDVFVLPSYREGLSRSAMEAAASGCALVLSDIRGCREIGEDGRHLLLVPPGDAASLARAVARLLDDHSLRERLGRNARRRARRRFDQHRVARTSLAVYREVMLRKAASRR
ncbi:MAG: glycosyltransferase [Actinobacteria bacterium]|nr:glycosyltransferase [Actinomycetota bacterium]